MPIKNKYNSDMEDLGEACKDYKLHLTVLISIVIAEYIGIIALDIMGVNIVLMPLLYSLVLAIAFYIAKPVKWIEKTQSDRSSAIMMLLVGPLLVKLAVASGQNLAMVFDVGAAIILEQIGNFGTILIGLPIALLLGFKREAIGMTSSICREPQMAVVMDRYGFTSPETRGFFTVFLIGTVLGTPFVSIMASILAYVIPLHPYAYGMACGIGSASMNAAAVASLSAIYPNLATQLEAFSGMANLIAMVTGMYVYIFAAIPLTEKMYDILEPITDRILTQRNANKEE
ncbi:MAG: hypothetical protein BZ138_00390 [Methanosphaera sp. rholeuAM270]|nr:MAG: hypothetical protein BZ138_00390 [Methanosphaera sp. rholeuAM270]